MIESTNVPKYAERIKELDQITRDFLSGVGFIAMDTSRYGDQWKQYLLSYLIQNIIETSLGILLLAKEGVHDMGKRELRFLLELAIKVCYIEQSHSDIDLAMKLTKTDHLLNSPNISLKRDLKFSLLDEPRKKDFLQELGRLYGLTSNWVHLTTAQVQDRVDRDTRNITAGKEGLAELDQLIELLERIYASSLVLLFHSVPEYVAGDFLVESDGQTHQWHFASSQFIAAMDASFDYKHERKSILDDVKKRRTATIRF